MVLITESVQPLLPVATNFTEYVPNEEYTFVGLASMLVSFAPAPKYHFLVNVPEIVKVVSLKIKLFPAKHWLALFMVNPERNLIVIAIAAVVSYEPPDANALLYQVFVVNEGGE